MPSHTPGPWAITSQDGADFHVTAPDGDDDPWNVAVVVGACGYPDDPRTGCTEGNARLIAAAPELLEALKAADEALAQFTAFEDDARHIMGNTNFAIVQQRREQVRAAIAKAEGATP